MREPHRGVEMVLDAERPLYHVTVLSNFARGFDKYARTYSKAGIPESTFPDRFFLLRREKLPIGIDKAQRLLAKLAIDGDRLIVLETAARGAELLPNERTGLGQYLPSPSIRLTGLHDLLSGSRQAADLLSGSRQAADYSRLTPAAQGEEFSRLTPAAQGDSWQLQPLEIEEATALSLRLLQPNFVAFAQLRPRTLSILPIAKGCQAACPFCFSEASVSAEQEQARIDFGVVDAFAAAARARGAERFVITGGGEPGLVPHAKLTQLMRHGAQALGKAVLITNGHHLTKLDGAARRAALRDYYEAGLGVLAVSRHHYDDDVNARLMNLQTQAAEIAATWREQRDAWPGLRLRFTCVLQRGGVDTPEEIERYVAWCAAIGVEEICFKELYVSTSIESVYHTHAANAWSRAHQAPLSLVLDFAAAHEFREVARLPWGAPVFRGAWHGERMQIAAYTEPSLFWERTQAIARSWNLMADGRCLASLEDRASEISREEAA